MVKAGWQKVLAEEIPSERLSFELPARQKFSRDFSHFSPVLSRELEDEVADCIVWPTNEEELDSILSVAVSCRVPITVRGGGTGNYGQAVPLAGGIVIDMSQLNQLLEVAGESMSVQSGAKMGRMEAAAREVGKELRIFPSTYQTATIGGFISGGSGGIGSIEWGTVWEGIVRAMTIKTIEENPRVIRLTGEDVEPYIHNYGVSGIVTELAIALTDMHDWTQWAITFDTYNKALDFGIGLAVNQNIKKRLVSIHEAEIASYFTNLKLPPGKAVVLLEIAQEDGAEFLRWVDECSGTVSLRIQASHYHRGIGVSDHTWNHTTLWARKMDAEMTYLQTRFSPQECKEQMAALKAEFPESLMHVELMKSRGRLVVSGLPLLRYTTDERLQKMMDFCESIGVSVANPHTWRLEFGGRSPELVRLGQLKRQNDPHGLLNPKKLETSLNPEQAV